MLGMSAILALFVFGATFLAASGAMGFAENIGAPRAYGVLAAPVAVLNPWVYSEYVAGHIFMVFAYAVGLALLAELSRVRPRNSVLVILSALAITQLEFFLVLAIPFIYWCIRNRRGLVLTSFLISSLPIIAGILFRYGGIRGTEYLLIWQRAASVRMVDGALLSGYEFRYANAFAMVWPALLALGLLALVGLFAGRRKPIIVFSGVLAIVALIAASGTTGPVAALYSWMVLHVPESGVFRELYDLIAIVAIGYVIGISALPKGKPMPKLLFVAVPAVACLFIPWIAKPVYSFFVPSSVIPRVAFASKPQQRVALFPAFQPLSYRGQGSGYDPDLFDQSGGAIPINEFVPSFPANAALGYAWKDGDTRLLESLGVALIISRPYLNTNWTVLRYQQASLHRPA
ncbi:MAG: hypothetical protein ACYDA1_09625, partial [Vulcanimicrobiaceae bacterium]